MGIDGLAFDVDDDALRELPAQFRAGIVHDDDFATALPAWSAAVGRHFSGCLGCC